MARRVTIAPDYWESQRRGTQRAAMRFDSMRFDATSLQISLTLLVLVQLHCTILLHCTHTKGIPSRPIASHRIATHTSRISSQVTGHRPGLRVRLISVSESECLSVGGLIQIVHIYSTYIRKVVANRTLSE